MAKIYTAQEMREFANCNDAAYARNPSLYSSAVSAALRQAADAMDREVAELKTQVRIAKDAFFKIARRNHSQEIYDIVCEAEFMMNHPECRKVTNNG